MLMSKIKSILIVTAITISILFAFEICARFYISFERGNSNVGVSERNQNLNYQAFTMWGKNLDSESKVFNNQIISENTFKILLLGASTAEAFNSDTLESDFSRYINRPVKVFNAASGGFNIRQEAIALSLVAESVKPDLILVLDGANDIIHATRPGTILGTTYVDRTYQLMLQKPWFSPFVYLLQNSQLFNGVLSKTRRNTYDSAMIDSRVADATAVYLQTRDFINLYAKGANIPIIFILQPFVGFSRTDNDAAARNLYKYRENGVLKGFKLISNMDTNGLCFLDSNREIENKKLNLHFSDDVHFKDSIGYHFLSTLFLTAYKSCFIK